MLTGDKDTVDEASRVLRAIEPDILHDDIELAELRSISVTFDRREDVEARYIACLTSQEASSEHRVVAATCALKYADMHGRDAFAIRICNSVADSDVEQVREVVAMEFKMLACIVRGSPDDGATLARQWLAAKTQIDSPEAGLARMNAAIMFIRAGYTDEGVESLESAIHDAVTRKANTLAIRCMVYRAYLLCDLGRMGESLNQMRDADLLVETHPHLGEQPDYLITRTEFALAQGKTAEAVSFLEAAHAELIWSGSDYARRWHAALSAHLLQLQGEPIDIDLDSWLTAEDLLPITTLRDVEIAVVCKELQRRGARNRARTIAEEYGAQRPRRGPCSRLFQIVLAEIDRENCTSSAREPAEEHVCAPEAHAPAAEIRGPIPNKLPDSPMPFPCGGAVFRPHEELWQAR
jgi:hypothetical protein